MEPTTYGIHAAKTQLSQLIEQALAGQDVVITRNGQPLVRLQVIEPEQHPKPRIGGLKGRIFNTDASDALDAEVAALFEAH